MAPPRSSSSSKTRIPPPEPSVHNLPRSDRGYRPDPGPPPHVTDPSRGTSHAWKRETRTQAERTALLCLRKCRCNLRKAAKVVQRLGWLSEPGGARYEELVREAAYIARLAALAAVAFDRAQETFGWVLDPARHMTELEVLQERAREAAGRAEFRRRVREAKKEASAQGGVSLGELLGSPVDDGTRSVDDVYDDLYGLISAMADESASRHPDTVGRTRDGRGKFASSSSPGDAVPSLPSSSLGAAQPLLLHHPPPPPPDAAAGEGRRNVMTGPWSSVLGDDDDGEEDLRTEALREGDEGDSYGHEEEDDGEDCPP